MFVELMNLLLRLCCKKFMKHVIVFHSWSINTLKHLRDQWETESLFKASGLWAESLKSQLGSVMLGYPLGNSGHTSSFVDSFTSVHTVLGSFLKWVPFSLVSEMWWQPPSYLAVLIPGSLFWAFPFLQEQKIAELSAEWDGPYSDIFSSFLFPSGFNLLSHQGSRANLIFQLLPLSCSHCPQTEMIRLSFQTPSSWQKQFPNQRRILSRFEFEFHLHLKLWLTQFSASLVEEVMFPIPESWKYFIWTYNSQQALVYPRLPQMCTASLFWCFWGWRPWHF